MKIKRNGVTFIALALSAAVFMTTALADTLIGSGYESLKNSIKLTAAQMQDGIDNFTLESMYVIKDNGTTLMEYSDSLMVDNKNWKSISSNSEKIKNQVNYSNYTYKDENVRINKRNSDEKYYVYELSAFNRQNQKYMTPNPFEQEQFADIEKIFDAAVGGLKDYVQVEEDPNGGKVYSGSISQTQVPALINAIASFGCKQITNHSINNDEYDVPKIKSDIYIKNISGKLIEDNDGRATSLVGELIFSGNDENGLKHDMSMEVMFNLKDINSTIVQKPNLEGKKVEVIKNESKSLFNKKFIGKYKSNIIADENDGFVKVGERILTINNIEDNIMTGSYSEIYLQEQESEQNKPIQFDFELDLSDRNTQFSYNDEEGNEQFGVIHPAGTGNIYITFKSRKDHINGELERVFEE